MQRISRMPWILSIRNWNASVNHHSEGGEVNKIAVVNESTVREVEKSIPDLLWALQRQVSVDLYPIWGVSGLLFPWNKLVSVPPGYWELVLADDSNQVGALGYHETTKNGDPIGFVFVKDDLKYGTSWT